MHYNPLDPYNGHEYIDLGLPSGKKWAKYLLGMSGETDIENALYFAWGATTGCTADDTGATPNDWAHAPFNNGSSNYNETYFNSVKDTVCPNGILAQEYDAVHAILGGNWRMPTEDDFQELTANTTYAIETSGGVKGMRFTSKTNGNSLFIPFIGLRNGSDVGGVGGNVSLWSSSLRVSNHRYAVTLYASSIGGVSCDGYGHYNGFGVLGVI